MASLQKEELWRSHITGRVYRIKRVTDQMVVLESINGFSQVLLTKGTLDLFYTNVFSPKDGEFHLKGNDRLVAEGDSSNRLDLSTEKDFH